MLIAFSGKLRHTAFCVMHNGAAKSFMVGFFTGNRFDDFGTGNIHIARIFHHEDKVCHGR